MSKITVLSSAVLAALLGCSRPSFSQLPYEKMSKGDFVAVVNGVGYTKGELERDVALTEKILTLAGLSAEDMLSRKNPMTYRRSVINGFVAREVLLNEAKKRHLELSPSDMERFQNQFADQLSGKRPMNFAAVLAAVGKDATAFRNNLKKDALSAKIEAILKERLAASVPSPDPSAVTRERQQILAANRQVEADNITLFRLATNAWKSIRAGNDFADVARKLPSLHKGIVYEPDYDDQVGRFTNVASTALTPPTAVGNGLEIAKIAPKHDGSQRISRLVFTPMPLQPVPSVEVPGKSSSEKAVNARYAELLKALKQSADISVAK